MTSFDDILNNSKNFSIDDVQKDIEDDSNAKYDDGFWNPTTDKAGNALCEFRFLPPPAKEKSAFVSYFSHYFKGKNGKTYSERSLSTLGQDDPVGKENSRLWNTGYEADKAIARARKRKKNFVANVLILRDPNAPENEGKIKKYRYGVKIQDKIKKAMNPEFDGDEAINPFDLLGTGANFRLKVTKQGEFKNYDDSSFGPRGPLFGGDIDKMRKTFEGQEMASLAAEIAPDKFKTYDELAKRLAEVLSDDDYMSSAETASTTKSIEDVVGLKTEERKADPVKESAPEVEAEEEDDDVAFFKKLAQG